MGVEASKVVDSGRAKGLAKTFSPIIYQEWCNELDCICPIALGDPNEIVADFPFLTQKPYLYYGVREDALHLYIFFMVYHVVDYSTSGIKIIKDLDEHRHDTECILFRSYEGESFVDVITVAHERFRYQKNTDRRVTIEKGGHAIYPYSQKPPSGNYLVYKTYSGLANLNEMSLDWWNITRKAFNGIRMPDEQADSVMMKSSSSKLVNKRGDIFNRPEVLFASAESRGWI